MSQSTVVTDKKIRFRSLDGLRGVASLLVVFGHFRRAFFVDAQNSDFSAFLWKQLDFFFLSAGFSVQLFFVLSGFVLGYNSFYRDSFLKKQWIKRFFRLVLPVFLSSVLYFVFLKGDLIWFDQLRLDHTNDWIDKNWSVELTWSQFLGTFIYRFLFFSDWQFIWNINSALWTIPIELYWSYILFICFFITKMAKKVWAKNILFAAGILLFLRFTDTPGEPFAVLFLYGALMALNLGPIKQFFLKWYMKLLLLVCILAYLFIVEKGWLPEIGNYHFEWSFLAAISFVLLILVSDRLQRLFSVSIIHWLGRVSFALYLLHMLVIGSLGAWMYVKFPFLQANMGLIILLFITTSASLGLAYLFTRYVDEPLMKLFDVYYKRISGLKTATVAVSTVSNKEKNS